MGTVEQFVWIDYVIVAIIFVSSIISLIRGFAKEALSLLVWILSIGIAWIFFRDLAMQLEPYVEPQSVRLGIAFAVLMISVLVLGGLINYIIFQVIQKTGLSGTDRLLGMVFGLFRGVTLVAVLVWLAGLTPFPEDEWWQESVLLDDFTRLSIKIKESLPADISDYFIFDKQQEH